MKSPLPSELSVKLVQICGRLMMRNNDGNANAECANMIHALFCILLLAPFFLRNAALSPSSSAGQYAFQSRHLYFALSPSHSVLSRMPPCSATLSWSSLAKLQITGFNDSLPYNPLAALWGYTFHPKSHYRISATSSMDERTLFNSGPHQADPGGSMLQGASNVYIRDSTLNAYGSSGIDEKKRIVDAMVLLASRAEPGAPYDAAAREDVPKCHEHTRVAIVDGIHYWAHSLEPGACPLMWMYGPAGSGKTTIMQTVAETFDKEGSLAASVFFSRLSGGRPRNKENFVITLAHQLSRCIPALQQPLADGLSDPAILTKSLAKQLDALVIGPMKMLDPTQIGARCIFLVDGLDECNGDTAQRDILNLLEHLLHQTGHRIRILVASRSLSHIQSFFAHGRIGEITRTNPLDNDYQSDEDVKQFFNAEFAKIRVEHPSRGGLASEWPSSSDIDILVKRASGQFIYASVVIKFIADHGRHPHESLKTIVGLVVNDSARPYEALDAVYAQVLSTIEPRNFEFAKTVMGCLLLPENFDFNDIAQNHSPETLDDVVFMSEPGTTIARINRLSPLITISSDGMRFTHASFPEYLLDRSRSKEFFLDMRKVQCTLARHWFRIYSTHFKLHPHGGLISTGIASCFSGSGRYGGANNDTILFDVISNCVEAEWTAELRQDICSFNVEVAFTLSAKDHALSGAHILWNGISRWLDFMFWIEQNHCLPSTETENILLRIDNLIQSVFSKLSIDAPRRRVPAALITLRKLINVEGFWRDVPPDFGPLSKWEWTRKLYKYDSSIFQDHVSDASSLWLCKTLAMDAEMNGVFFADGTLYTDVALLYARASENGCADGHCVENLPFILSKAAPSEELATLLTRKFLQVQRESIHEKTDKNVESFFRAIIIYLFECGVPFLSEHQHGPEFHLHSWECGICMFLDPFNVEYADIEISTEPAVEPLPDAAQVPEEAPEHLQIHLIWHEIPGFPLMWLRAWIFWFADMIRHFFLVVA
ncbi:hypothetical protein D9619_013682 [Psilocybe cf. subviscida]|uniref:Nephrocystin 3-like N-terminal domain-containing protein n=1 Tax=Psilocybe cf. subviscida TaxID=2480587 RepID=A0A8H5AZ60_9AGAR|nr:hypothetical protein D9619_013682 [Psilocybe cf. subviscida]